MDICIKKIYFEKKNICGKQGVSSSTLDRAIRYNFRSFGNGFPDWSRFQRPIGTISNFIKAGQLVRNVASH